MALSGPDLLLKHASDEAIDVGLRRLFIAYASFGDIANTSSLSSAKFSKLTRSGSKSAASLEAGAEALASRAIGSSSSDRTRDTTRDRAPYQLSLDAFRQAL